MQKCNNCGSEFEGNYCDYCGMPADTQTQGYTEIPQYDTNFMRGDSINQNYSYTTPNSEQPTTTLGWIGWQLLEAFLPLIGLIIMLIFSEDETVKNYAKTTYASKYRGACGAISRPALSMVSNARLSSPSPASIAPDSPKTMWLDGLPRRISSLSMHGRSSCISE